MTAQFSTTERDLVTDRLVLRSWTPTDVDAVLRDIRQPAWSDDFPADGDRVIASLFAERPAWFDDYGHRLILERESGAVVGSIGLFWPPHDGVVEIGFGVVASRRGLGYALDAANAVTRFALGSPRVRLVSATVELANTASIRVLDMAGFRRQDGPDVETGQARYIARL